MTTTAPPAAPVDRPRPPARPRHRLRLALVFCVLAGALVFLLVAGLGSSLDYFDTVDQALAHKASLGTTTFRLEGMVVAGTVRHTEAGADFVVSEGDHRVPVANTGSPPQLFQAGIPVVVVGHFTSAGSDQFVSDQILVKHTEQYIASYPTRVRAQNGSVR